MHTRAIGKYYEELAAKYLMEQGYGLICKNFHTKFGEIDLIFFHNNYN